MHALQELILVDRNQMTMDKPGADRGPVPIDVLEEKGYVWSADGELIYF